VRFGELLKEKLLLAPSLRLTPRRHLQLLELRQRLCSRQNGNMPSQPSAIVMRPAIGHIAPLDERRHRARRLIPERFGVEA